MSVILTFQFGRLCIWLIDIIVQIHQFCHLKYSIKLPCKQYFYAAVRYKTNFEFRFNTEFYLQQDRFTWFSGWLYPVVILEVAHKKYHRCKQKERSPLNLRIIRLSRGARCSNATVSGAVQIRGAEGEVANKSRGSFALYRRLTSATRDVTCSTSLCSHLHFVNVIWKSTLPMFNISTTEIAAGLRLEHLLDSRLYMVSVFFFLSSEMRVVFSPLTNSNWPLRVWWYVRNLMFYDLTFSCVTACRKLAHWPQPILDSIGMQNIVAYVLASDKWFLSIYRFQFTDL